MNFNKHLLLEGQHAFLGASKYHWVNYDEDKLVQAYSSHRAKQRGTELHDLAENLIKLGVKLPRSTKTLNMYVNDAIGFNMETEQVLFYSFNCYGTVDSIKFHKNTLRIHDLKTGVTKTSFMQLKVYTALFCLEYDVNPNDIEISLRIYQNDEIYEEVPEPEEILYIMSKIINSDKIIESLKIGG